VNKLLRKALFLAILTVSYNILEGFVSVIFGADDETLALFGFGLDSFVEVISGIGILHLIFRMNYGKVEQRDKFEKTALKITGFAFYLLAAGLVAGAILIVVNSRDNHFSNIYFYNVLLNECQTKSRQRT
jgi:hypothetical protein